jgi:glycosyltransferase involved in cell wall biosynthesis
VTADAEVPGSTPEPTAGVAEAIRHPGRTARAWQALPPHKQAQAIRLVSARLPGPLRRGGWRLVAVTMRPFARGTDHPLAIPATAMAEWELGRRDAAEARIREVGGGGGTRTAVRAAAVAMAVERPALAAAALGERALGRGRDHALAAEVAFRTGRYEVAATEIEAAATAGYHHDLLTRLDARLASERTVLEPGWHPTLERRSPALTREPGRILHLVTNSLPDTQAGYTLRSRQVARSQSRAGLDPQMATRPGYPGDSGRRGAPSAETVDGVRYHRLLPDAPVEGLPDVALARHAAAAAALVEDLRPAALQPASNLRNAQVALALRDRFGLPVVYEVRGFLEETWLSRQDDGAEGSERYVSTRAAETACMLAADAVVTLSETMRRDIIGRGVDADRVIVVPNAVEPDAFLPRPRDAALASTLGIAADETVVGYISTLNAYEGVDTLVRAVARLRDTGRTVRLLVVGDGPERASLQALTVSLGLDRRTAPALFSGRVPNAEIADYYSLIDVFVVPRTADRVSQLVTPLKPYEAMAMERALVASDVDALREIVDDGTTGLLFRAGDAEDLARVLEPLLDDPERRAALGGAARAWVLEHRTWDRNGARYRELFERLGAR